MQGLHTIAEAQRGRNLRSVINGRDSLPDIKLTPWQRETLGALKLSGRTAYAKSDGTIQTATLREAPSGGFAEQWVTLVTAGDLTKTLGDLYGV